MPISFLPGKEVWWENDEAGNVIFRDGDKDPEIHSEGPKILHFQNASYSDVTTRAKRSWMEIQQQEITIPLGAIRNFSSEGQPTVNIYAQPIESGSTSMITEDSTIDSDMDCSDSSQVRLTDSLNSESLLFSPTLVSTPKRPMLCHSVTDRLTTDSKNTQLHLSLNESMVNDPANNELKTTLAKGIAKVLGSSEDLVKFDKVRYLTKQLKTPSMIETYQQMVKVLRKKVLKRVNEVKSKMKEVEQYTNCSNGKYKDLQKELQIATRVFSNL